MKTFFYLILLGLISLFFSCGSSKKLPTEEKQILNLQKFSVNLMEEFKFPADSMKKLQFFSPDSVEINLIPVIKHEHSFVLLKDGTLNLNKTNKTSLVIPGATPGVLKEFTISADTKKIDLVRVYFEEAYNAKEDGKFLTFKNSADTAFVLVAKEYQGIPNVVKFGNEHFQVETKGKQVFLYFNQFGMEQQNFPKIEVKGKKIKNKS